MHRLRPALSLVAALAAVPIGFELSGLDASLLWNPRPLLLVVALPFVFLSLSHGVTAGPRALGLALGALERDLPPHLREEAGGVLRELGGLSCAVGAAVFGLEIVTLLVLLSSTPGQAAPMELFAGMGAALIAPVYGIGLKALVHDPLATSIEPAPAELAELLSE